MENISRIFIELVRAEICNTDPQLNKDELTPEVLAQLYKVSFKHDLTHLVALQLKRQGLLSDDIFSKEFLRRMRSAAYRYETMKYAENIIRELFQAEGIDFVPLKGAVIEKFYPQPWMRTRSDIDILVREEDFSRAKKLLIESCHYRVHKNNYHDVALVTPENIIVELHFRILEHEENIDRGLGLVWDFVEPVEAGSCEYQMTAEYLLFHVMAHMYYHFMYGGCGLRFVLDAWLLKNQLEVDEKKLQEFYELCHLETFAGYTEKLADICFGIQQPEHDAVTAAMEEYIITGGLFGSFESKIKARKTQGEGKKRYIVRRIFMPLHELQASYPILEKKPALYPVYMVKRWAKMLQKETRSAAMEEIKVNEHMDKSGVDQLKALFDHLKGNKSVEK